MGVDKKCSMEIIVILSILKFDIFMQNYKRKSLTKMIYGVTEGDLLSEMNILNKYKYSKKKGKVIKVCRLNIDNVNKAIEYIYYLQALCKVLNIEIINSSDLEGENIIECILNSYILKLAIRQTDGFYILNDYRLKIHPSSVLCNEMPEYILCHSFIKENENMYILKATKISKEYLLSINGDYFENKSMIKRNLLYLKSLNDNEKKIKAIKII